jgi:hypothetical protein
VFSCLLLLTAFFQQPLDDAVSFLTWNDTHRQTESLSWQAFTLVSAGAEQEARSVIRQILVSSPDDPDALRYSIELDALYPKLHSEVLQRAFEWRSNFSAAQPAAVQASVSNMIQFLETETMRRDQLAAKRVLLWAAPLLGLSSLIGAVYFLSRRFA